MGHFNDTVSNCRSVNSLIHVQFRAPNSKWFFNISLQIVSLFSPSGHDYREKVHLLKAERFRRIQRRSSQRSLQDRQLGAVIQWRRWRGRFVPKSVKNPAFKSQLTTMPSVAGREPCVGLCHYRRVLALEKKRNMLAKGIPIEKINVSNSKIMPG